jgi:hypothetical protein
MPVESRGFDDRHQAEAAVIGEHDARRCVGLDHDVVVRSQARARRREFIDILAELLFPAFRIDAHAPGHAQMHHPGLAAVQFGEEVFRAPEETFNPAARETFGKMRRKRHTQIAPPRHDLCQAVMLENRCQAHSHSLDFGKLRHRESGIWIRQDSLY